MSHGSLFAPRRSWPWLLALLLAGAPPPPVAALPVGEGEPFTQYFSPRDYHADTQCPCAAQDSHGVMYIGNIGSVLEYDGSSWRKIDVGHLHAVAGMAYEAQTDTIFVGARDDVGYLKRVPGGARVFVSLLDQLPPEARDVGVVIGVHATPEGVFFTATDRVLRWRDGHFKIWPLAPTTKLRSHWAAGHLYVSSKAVGLLRLDGETFVPAVSDPIFHDAVARSVLTDADGTLIVATVHAGLFTVRDNAVQPLEGDCEDFLKEKGILKALLLRDGSLAIATEAAGLVVLDRNHHFRSRLDETGGLHGNNLMNLFEDAEGGLWIGLETGVARAEVNSPLSFLRAGPDDDFSDVSSDDHAGDKLFLSSATGIYRVTPANASTAVGAHLEPLPGVKEGVNAFCVVENGLLLVSSGKLTHLDAEAKQTPVPTIVTNLHTIQSSRMHPGRVFVGDPDGQVGAVHLDAATGRWIDDGVMVATGEAGEFRAVESPQGDLWMGTKDHGLFRVQFVPGGPPTITSYLDRPGPLRGKRYVMAYDYRGPILFNTQGAVYRLDASGQNVEPVEGFDSLLTDGSLNIYNLLSTDPRSIWLIATDAKKPEEEQINGRAVAGANGQAPTFQTLPHKSTDLIGDLRDYFLAGDPSPPSSTLLLAGAAGKGVVRFDVRQWEAQLAAAKPFATLIRRAVTTGHAAAPILQEPLSYGRNSVHFEFAAGTVAFGTAPRFQTRLADFGAGDWSDWSERTSVDYLNLPEGRYTFEARARNADGQLGRVASLPFRILPPWQRTPWAYAAYALAAVLGLRALVRWRGRQLLQRNATLEALVNARTGELRAREADLLANEHNLVRARDDAESANRAKSAFLANMSHELRTPLNAILGYAQILLKQKNLPVRAREQVGVIGQSGGHLLSLINEVLDLSKIEAGKLTLSRLNFSLPPLLDEVGATFGPRLAEKRLTFTQTRMPGLPTTVHTDPSRLRQVLFNLLSNAVKFTHQGGVTLTVRPTEARRVRFEVADTGVGIDPAQLRNVFLAFHQAGESSLASQGTGLGLAISQHLVNLLGGRIEVDSTPGVGSRFWFELPLAAVESPGKVLRGPAEPAQGQVTGYEGTPRRLLLVDDLAENRRVLRDFLQPLGFEIEEAADGTDCLTACARRLPDAVLLDLRIGAPDGFEVARTLRSRTGDGPLAIIAISASVFESDRQQAIDAGCDDFLPKPFEETQLLGVLGRALNLRWVRVAPTTPAPPSVDNPATDEATAATRSEEAHALLELSLRGDIVGIRRRLDGLRTARVSDGLAVLVHRLEPLVATYQMEEIHALLLTFQSHDGP